MALIDKASLLMVPSVYEDGTLYNVLPSGNKAPDETGNHNGYDQTRADFTFSRGFNLAATRVNANGLIEKGRENVALNSNDFDGVYWSIGNSTITANATTSPNGTSDAYKIESSSVGTETRVRQSISLTTGNVYTFSCYMKAGNVDWAIVRHYGISSNGRAWFNLATGTIGTQDSSLIDAQIESVGDGWYRCSITGKITTTGAFDLAPAPKDNDYLSDAIGDYVFLWHSQAELGLVSTPYIETGATTATAGVLENTPRIDYSSGAGALLLEPQRTNLAITSEYAGGSGWFISSGYSVSHNAAISPEGLQNAFELTIPSVNGNTRAIISVSPSTEYTFSFYVKRGTATELKYSIFNLTNNSNIIAQTSYYSQTSATEWKRIEVTFTTPAGCTSAGVYIDRDSQANGTAFFYGIQCEQGSYATSYVPTYGSAATRGADSITSGTITAPLSGGYTAFIEVETLSTSDYNQIQFRETAANYVLRIGNQVNVGSGALIQANTTGMNKFALQVSSGGAFELFKNGSSVGTGTGITHDIELIKTDLAGQNVKKIIIFNEALTDAECQTLTA